MPTKTTSSKTSARKPATTTARKPAAKSAAAASESAAPEKAPAAKSSRSAPGKHPAPSTITPAARSRAAAESAAAAAAAAANVEPPKKRAVVESVSLIDEKKPKAKRPEGESRVRKSILPPISRIIPPPATPVPPKAEVKPVAPPRPPPPAVVDLISPSKPAPAAAIAPAEEKPAAPAEEISAAPAAEGETAAPTEGGEPEQKIIHIKPPIVVKHLATELGVKPHTLIAELMAFNIFANINQTIEPEVATKICESHGFVFEMERREKGGGVHKVVETVVAPPPPVIEKEEELKIRGPIIAFMGHVDHGKTSLMDAIRKTRVAAGEAGGITQHIGAYTVEHKGARITFLDTPGHAAFTAMRARGAHVTDIVVLVVAADDGLMPQTIEAINHAKAAEHVKIIVAINKIDLPGANPDRVKKQLQEKGLAPEDWGGETIVCEVSATKGVGIEHLLEMMMLQAEVMELKSSPTAVPRGTVIEAQVEAGRGPTATVIVQMGTLKTGDPFICGDFWGKVKSMLDDRGKPLKTAGPSTPVKVLGFTGLPQAGDEFLVMDSERTRQDAQRRASARAPRRQAEHAAARHPRVAPRSGRRQEASPHHLEVRRARFARSFGQRPRPDREQEDRPRDRPLRRRPDFRKRHLAG